MTYLLQFYKTYPMKSNIRKTDKIIRIILAIAIVQDEPVKIIKSATNKGLYELHLSWQDGGITYYFEKKIFI